MGIIGLVSILGASALLIPAFEFSGYSARVSAAGLVVYSPKQDFDWFHLLKCLVIYPGNTWLPLGCRAAGIGSLLAVLAAWGHPRKRDVAVFFILYLLFTDLTLGPPCPLATVIQKVDFLNITVSPWRAGPFSSLALAAVVAFGVEAAGRTCRYYKWRLLRLFVFLSAGSAMVVLLFFWLKAKPLHDTWYAVLPIPAITTAALCFFSVVNCPRVARCVVAVLVAAEILVWSAQMLPIYNRLRVAKTMPKQQFGTRHTLSVSNQRSTDVRPNWNMFTLDLTPGGYNPLYVHDTRRTLCAPNLENTYMGYMKVPDVFRFNQRGNLFAKRSFWLARYWVAGELPPKHETFPSATLVYLTDTPSGAPLSVPELERQHVPRQAMSDATERKDLPLPPQHNKVQKGDKVELRLPPLKIHSTHSALYVEYKATGKVDIVPECRDELGQMHHMKQLATVNTKGQEALLEWVLPDCETGVVTLRWPKSQASVVEITRAYLLKDLNDEHTHLEIVQRSANKVVVKVTDLPAPRLLVFIDSYYPGWQAKVDQQPVPILKANDAFKAVEVPEGSHEILFEFNSPSTEIGLMLSAATGIELLVALIILSVLRLRSAFSKPIGQ